MTGLCLDFVQRHAVDEVVLEVIELVKLDNAALATKCFDYVSAVGLKEKGGAAKRGIADDADAIRVDGGHHSDRHGIGAV